MIIHLTKNSRCNSFDKNIPDADSKKIIRHHFKLKKKRACRIHELCVEKEIFDIMINVTPCTVTRQGHSLSCESCEKFVYGKKVVFVISICDLLKINVQN